VAVQAGVVELGGRVASANQGADMRKIVESIQGVTQVTEKFEIIPRPFCAVLDLLEPIKKQAEDRGINFVTKLNKDGNIPDYYDKENLAITGKIPINFDSFIYVDYYAAAGNVGHLLPSPQQKTNRLASNQSFAVPDGRYEQKISADPPGLELITIIASKTSLFPVPRNNEPADVYLNELRQVLSKEKVKPDVTATFHFIRTNRETSLSP
jgi:hypothetical protein